MTQTPSPDARGLPASEDTASAQTTSAQTTSAQTTSAQTTSAQTVKADSVQGTILSPCIGICKIPQGTEHCTGCFRTREEIKYWRASDDSQRLEVLGRLKARRKQKGLIGQGEARPRRRK